jgi:hypothetical protein
MRGRANVGQSLGVKSILRLQRTIGNQAVQRLVQAKSSGLGSASGRFGHDCSLVHAKASTWNKPTFTVSTPGDIYEGES